MVTLYVCMCVCVNYLDLCSSELLPVIRDYLIINLPDYKVC